MKDKKQAKILAETLYLSAIDKKGKELHDITENFLAYIKDKKLQPLIPNVLTELQNRYFEENDMVATKVTSKTKLSDSVISKIQKLVKEKTKKSPEIETEEDEEMLGGAIIKFQDKVIDMSLDHQLKSLRSKLIRQ